MATKEKPTSDDSGSMVHNFAITMHNLGLARAAAELVKMLDSGRWRKFVQGFQTFEFLPGEFDYFLTQQDVTREQVMAIPDVEAKARLEEAMDERKTGEPGYRRSILEARAQIPQIPGRQIMPFGYTQKEQEDVKALFNGTGGQSTASHRPALGDNVRRWTESGGVTKDKASRLNPRPEWERLAAAALRLDDDGLEALYDKVRGERAKRKKRST